MTPQHIRFSKADGGVMHKVTIPGWTGWFSLWYDKDGGLLDAEAMDSKRKGRSIREGSACWTALQRKLTSLLA